MSNYYTESLDATTKAAQDAARAAAVNKPAADAAALAAIEAKQAAQLAEDDAFNAAVNAASSATAASASATSAQAAANLVGAPADSAIAAAVNGSTSSTRTALDGLYPRKGDIVANVKDYGAKGDGTTNDTTAIQNALNAAKYVYIPAGSYVASGLIVPTGTTLFGAGARATTILHNANNDCLAATGTSGTPLTGITVRDLAIQGNNGSTNQRGIFFQWVNDSVVSGVRISAVGNNAVNWYTSRRSKIIGCDVTAVGNFGILIYRSFDMLVQGNDVHDINSGIANLGIQLKSSQNCQVLSNRVVTISGYGIYTWDDGLDTVNYQDREHIISGNQIHGITTGGGFAGTGIYVNIGNGVRVMHNTATDCQVNSVAVAASVGCVVEGNRCSGSTAAAGIGLSAGTKFTHVAGNVISGYDQGIVLDAANLNRVQGNTVFNLRASASSLAAGVRIRNTSNNNVVMFNQCVDDQGTPTMKRGIYEELGNYNMYAFNVTSGATVANFTIISTNSVQMGNVSTLTDNPIPVGASSGKLGFFGASAVAKPTGTPAAATDAATTQALANDMRAKLISLGLMS